MKRPIGFYWKNLKKITYYNFIDELEKAISGCQSVLDLACGSSSPIKHLPRTFRAVGCDVFPPSVEKSKKEGIHDEYVTMDVLDLERKFPPKSFDCVLALDVIEHLEEKEGLRLIAMMEKVARKKVVVFTPNGFLPQEVFEGNVRQVHKSGWSVEEMRALGFRVIGIMGWKFLRGKKGSLKFSPKTFWSLLSTLSQQWVRNRPGSAFQLLCVKELGEGNSPLLQPNLRSPSTKCFGTKNS